MAAQRRLSLVPLVVAFALAVLTRAATVTYDFNITWVTANPDGLANRPVIGINGQWPLPYIEANLGDQVIVNTFNALGNESTSLHFHGLFMNGTTEMDGPSQVSQCPIPPGSKFTYNFTVSQPGTYWYHSHTKAQYPDGLRAPLIVHDPDMPFRAMYDEERVLSVSDWYHDQMHSMLATFISKANPTGAEPVPQSVLLNETQNLPVAVEPGRTYLFRMVNIGAFAGQYVWFEGHNMTILEVDGVYTHPAEASMIYLGTAQRCSFLITARNDTSANFPFVASMDTTLFDTIPDGLNWNVTGWLVYDSKKTMPQPASVQELNNFDDVTLVPWDNHTLYGEPDQTITLDVIMNDLGDGANYAFFNNITYVNPDVPTLYTVLTAGALATNPSVYGTYTHPFVLDRGQVVELVINNLDTGRHPFHLHGHNFQVLQRTGDNAGVFAPGSPSPWAAVPMRRDTLVLMPGGNMVLRFRADNPGVWLFHCHIEWHLASGLATTMVEAPLALQADKSLASLPPDHLAACAAGGVATTGNAAGNTADLLNLAGQPSPPPPLPEGFTPRGIVALVFSCVCGILGVAVVVWYGLAEHTNSSSLNDGDAATSPLEKDGGSAQLSSTTDGSAAASFARVQSQGVDQQDDEIVVIGGKGGARA